MGVSIPFSVGFVGRGGMGESGQVGRPVPRLGELYMFTFLSKSVSPKYMYSMI
jgi:hypothetical protein